MGKRLDPDTRRASLLVAGLTIAQAKGITKVTVVTVADVAKVTEQLVRHYFKNGKMLRSEVVRIARERGLKRVIAEADALGLK